MRDLEPGLRDRRPRVREHVEIMAGLPPGVRGVILRSPAEVATFTGNLPHSLTTA